MSSHTTLAAAADDRKARLAKLKSLKRKQPDTENESGHPADPSDTHDGASPPTTDVARLHLSGRNYDPETRGPKLGFEAPPIETLANPTLEEHAADIEEETRQQAALDEQDDKGIDLFKLQPKKPNWDLKRELKQKMEVLDVRTDNAIARMVRERLAAKKAAPGGGVAEEGMLDGTAMVEGMKIREREEEEEARREREAEAEGHA